MNQTIGDKKPIPGVKNIIAVGSGKGGVGKSTVTANLALALRDMGLKVGLLDADIYGPSVPRIFGAINQPLDVLEGNKIKPLSRFGIELMSIGFMVEEGSAVVWRGPMLFKAINQFLFDVQWSELDVLLVDLPPGTGDVQLTLAQKVPINGGVVITTPQSLSLIDAKKAEDMFDKVGVKVLSYVQNMSFLKNGENKIDLFPHANKENFLKNINNAELIEFPFYPELSVSAEAGIPLLESQPEHECSVQFRKLAEVLKGHLSL